MSCKAIIKYGKNTGKICGRLSCRIKGHEKYVEGDGKCQNIIKIGKNKNLKCGRINCIIHKLPKDFNLARYFNLSEYFINIIKTNKYIFTKKFNIKYLSMYENHLKVNKNKNECISDIKTLLYDCEIIFNSKIKIIKIILIFELLDTPNMNWFINKNEKFKKTIDDKIIIHQKLIEFPEFSNYFINNYETNKKYLSINLNKQYRKKILKKYMLSLLRFYTLYMKVVHNRYKPYEIGYYECQERFYKSYIELKN